MAETINIQHIIPLATKLLRFQSSVSMNLKNISSKSILSKNSKEYSTNFFNMKEMAKMFRELRFGKAFTVWKAAILIWMLLPS